MTEKILLHINGQDVPSSDGAVFSVKNPATGEEPYAVSHATPDDVDAAIQSGQRAFEDGRWRDVPARERARVLNRAAALLTERIDELARLETVQIGRTLREMRAQLRRLPEWLEYFGAVAQTAEDTGPNFGAEHLNVVRRVPIGVIGLITPWNHPLLITMKKLSAALAAGNSVVIKPSELGPVVPVLLAKLLEEAGVPAGVVNVIPGLGRTTGKALSEHPGLAKLDFTGGTETGRVIAANAGHSLIPVTAELGGKAPVLVFEDVDINRAAAGALFAAFIATGQTCVQGARILVDRRIYGDFVEALTKRVSALRLGDPLDLQTQMGPMVSEAQREKTADAVNRARAQGATVLSGGRAPEGQQYERGWFYEPTLVADVGPLQDLWYEEVFGPVTLVVPFDNEADAIQQANDSPFGLAASVWTQEIGRAIRVSKALQCGIVWINDHHRIDPASPWGGFKDSGLGSENGLDAYNACTKKQSLIINTSDSHFDWFASVEDLRYS
ncbi:aldehyde dehydrogenase family protein [[Micrococcus luteus] ATCC 49442]|uniref:aldehyde dehydrogenase family protein n=1 Tax=[Micrococcus luteus] ATCC 49442 TaxID=2698727 RepID=UPI0013DD1A53|nr:aldehyde dehydrogenase family protein [[Micrococcus luteus] ATCC 49442]